MMRNTRLLGREESFGKPEYVDFVRKFDLKIREIIVKGF
jgi:hypothetical protein